MTLFEYLSVAISIVLSLAAVRLINGLPHAAATPQRYWVHLGYVILVSVQIVLVWWNNWAYRKVDDWVFSSFLLVLLAPATLYFMSVTLIPDEPATIDSWREYFFRIHPRFFLAYLFLFGLFTLSSWLLLELPIVHPQRLAHALGVAGCALGASSDNPRLHQALVFCFMLVFTLAIVVFFLKPGNIPAS